jgi:sulfite reductase alpha subunit-like flavoprotein
MAATRVLVVFGSESGCSEGTIKKIAKNLTAKNSPKFKIVATMRGNDAAEMFEMIKDYYDVLLVATSSFGEGDAPEGFGKFLYRIKEGSKAEEKPLAGLQHAVLGYGSSEFETYQNCPRLTDKYLGLCGSRRFVQRTEIDQMEEFKEVDTAIAAFENAVWAALSQEGTKAEMPPVCDWTVPADTIREKTLGPEGYIVDELESSGGNTMLIAAVVLVAVGAVVFKFVLA